MAGHIAVIEKQALPDKPAIVAEDEALHGDPEARLNQIHTTRGEFLKGTAWSLAALVVLKEVAIPESVDARTAHSRKPKPPTLKEKIAVENSQTKLIKARAKKEEARLARTKARTASETLEEDSRKLRIDNDYNASWFHRAVAAIAEVAPSTTLLLGVGGGLWTVRKAREAKKEAWQKQANEADAARWERLQHEEAAVAAQFTSLHKRLLLPEAQWRGADSELLAFAEGHVRGYEAYGYSIFNLTRDVLRSRTDTEVTPAQSNVIGAFLSVLEPLRTEERMARGDDLTGVPLLDASRVNLAGANLVGEDLSDLNLDNGSLAGANVDLAIAERSFFKDTDVTVKSATGAQFSGNQLDPSQITALQAAGAQVS
jgi:uncharacterized protein YjbI with pentapeptide repeats